MIFNGRFFLTTEKKKCIFAQNKKIITMPRFIDSGNLGFQSIINKRIVLCGINYNKATSKHEVEMEVIE
jgi:hypothetical protein